MGHNTSSCRVAEQRAREAKDQRVLAGWRWNGAKLEELVTAEGVLARGGVLQGRGQTGECRRYVQVDLHWWVRHGLGDTGLKDLGASYRCARLGCSMAFRQESYPAGIPIQCYVGAPERLAVRCRKCLAGRTLTAEQVIAALERAGTGDGNAGVLDLGRRIHGKCPA